jgi:quercetin dioxygenase-like cupin family protein
MADYEMTSLAEIRTVEDNRRPTEDESRRWHQVRHHFGISAFGVNAFTADAGQLIGEHTESQQGNGQEELYIVLSGHAAFVLDGVERDAPEGTFLYVEPGVKRGATAQAPATTVVVVGAKPGQAYEVSNFEMFAPAWALYEKGEYAAAADLALPLADTDPSALILYNIACVESLAGRHDAALEHLQRALSFPDQPGMVERLRKLAREDKDLDAIRGEPGFPELDG